ncbi:succinate dehydrogenase cytochrome b subunit [Candidatus Zixiibacteriota bacterium]
MSNNSPPNLLTASVGKKIIMAVSGIIVIGFVIVHLIGNLQLFIGQEQLNKYAETLQNLGVLKWCFRIFILAFFGFHVWKGFVLWLENKKARPVSYTKDVTLEASLSSRTMIWTGGLIFSFVVYHLLHYTMIITNPEYAIIPLVDGRFDVYSMVILGFQNYLISGIYIIAILLMSFHLSHAISSLFQTLGLNNPNTLPKLKIFSNLVAVIIFCGYVSMPIAVLLNIIKLPGGGN